MLENISAIKSHIEKAYEKTASGAALSGEEREAVDQVIDGLDLGQFRVSEKTDQGWITHAWIKKAILLYFRMKNIDVMTAGEFSWADKVPVKRFDVGMNIRAVPPAFVRKGAYIESGVVLMPSYVNIGAYVGKGSMIDTWATVGSCAQIGQNVHVSGGVGIGGVLEPAQAQPVIIEDGVFLGSRAIVVEGVMVEEGAVIGAGVVLTQSSKIIDVTGSEPVTYRGRVPARSVVIPGSVPRAYPAGTYQVPCALIIGRRSEKTDLKTSLNDALREFEIPV